MGAGGKISALLFGPALGRKRIWVGPGLAGNKTHQTKPRLHSERFFVHLKDGNMLCGAIFQAS